ncbi:MAG: sporulation protein YtfJ [Clostridia bacterium]|nr:sporulation protein YtfJ [Clostridia bacterium]
MAENTSNTTEKIGDIISSSLEKIKTIAGGETVVGAPIPTPGGTTIIPVSKISVGFASGGLDYGGKTPEKNKNFGGGGGTGISVTPVAFLVVSPSGSVELLSVANAGDPLEKLTSFVDKTPDMIDRLRSVFTKKPAPEAAAEEETGK